MKIVKMVSSNQLFQFIQKTHQAIGIHPSQSEQKQCSINLKNKIFLFVNAENTVTTIAFIVFDAKSIIDYGIAFFVMSTTINITIIHSLFTWQVENTLKFFENCEEFIEMSLYTI